MGISSGIGDVLAPVSYGFRNVIINGNFSINQRVYASGTNLASGSYGFDRWKSTFTNTALTFTSAPQGQLVTISSGGSIEQVVERANVPAGSYVLSWSGTARGRVYNVGSTPPAYAASPVFVTLDGTANVEVEFAPASGTATLGEVQLERGQRQTPFEFRPVGVELALCQRYYQRIGGEVVADVILNGYVPANAQLQTFITFPVALRTSPSLAQRVGIWTVTNSCGQVTVGSAGSKGAYIFAIANSGISNPFQSNVYTNSTGHYLEFGAEL